MIKDKLSNSEWYYGLSKRIEQGLLWLKSTDLKNIEDGKYFIDGDNIYANVQSYYTKENAPFEAHRKYIDIQYMIRGVEIIGVAQHSDCTTRDDYDREKDLEFLDCKENQTTEILREGEFLIFYPQDAHQPSLDYKEKLFVKKVVVKVAI